VATRDGNAVAYLGGDVDSERGLASWSFAGHAAEEPEALRDLFAVQAAELGLARFMVTVPATDAGLVDAWFRLAFGCQAVMAVREIVPHEPVAFGGTIRRSVPDDLEQLLDLDEALYAHQRRAPSFSEYDVPPRERMRADAADTWDEEYEPFVAERGGRIEGLLLLYRRPDNDLRVPANNIDLAFAATREDVRGGGIGLALTAHAMNWAGEHGFHSMTVDWRSVNLLASRFWTRRGFRPQYLRLYRAVP
jgi:GNAT superfamily N-acetyltransferase